MELHVDELFKSLSLKTYNSSENIVIATQLIQDIESALEQNETSTKWFKEMDIVTRITTEDMVLALDICNSEFRSQEAADAENDRFRTIEAIAKRCLQAEINIRHCLDSMRALNIAEETMKLIQRYHGSNAEEYKAGFRYVVDCLMINARIKMMMPELGEQCDVTQLKGYLKDVNKFEAFGTKDHVAVLAIKQYFCGNLRKSDYDLQIETSEKVYIISTVSFVILKPWL